jgi:aminoglycoside 6'-N-acetyltransferase I
MTAERVRRASPADLSTVLDLATAFYAEDGFSTPKDQLRENLVVLLDSESARVAVACGDDDAIVGFAITTLSFGLEYGHSAELEDLFVVPAKRGNGIGEILIADSADWAASRGCSVLEIVVAPNGSDVSRLVAYYARRGFTDEGRRLLSRNLATASR